MPKKKRDCSLIVLSWLLYYSLTHFLTSCPDFWSWLSLLIFTYFSVSKLICTYDGRVLSVFISRLIIFSRQRKEAIGSFRDTLSVVYLPCLESISQTDEFLTRRSRGWLVSRATQTNLNLCQSQVSCSLSAVEDTLVCKSSLFQYNNDE